MKSLQLLLASDTFCSRTSHSLVKERGVGDDQRRWHGRVVPAFYLLHETIALCEGRHFELEFVADLDQGTVRRHLEGFRQSEDRLLELHVQIGQRTYLN